MKLGCAQMSTQDGTCKLILRYKRNKSVLLPYLFAPHWTDIFCQNAPPLARNKLHLLCRMCAGVWTRYDLEATEAASKTTALAKD